MENQNDMRMQRKDRGYRKGYFKILISFLIILILTLIGMFTFYNIKNYQLEF